jgi:hypothetical protein
VENHHISLTKRLEENSIKLVEDGLMLKVADD